MGEESNNLGVMRRYYAEVWNERRRDTLVELVAPELIAHYEHTTFRGRNEWMRNLHNAILGALPNLVAEVEDMVAHDDVVVTRWRASGRHEGELFGVAPSGEQLDLRGMSWARLRDGRVVELWSSWDVSYLRHRVVAELERFRSLLNICMYCNRIKNETGEWERPDSYIHRHFHRSLSHGVCPTCFEERLPEDWGDPD